MGNIWKFCCKEGSKTGKNVQKSQKNTLWKISILFIFFLKASLRLLLTSIEEYLGVASNLTIQENVKENALESAGDMFIYLLTCTKQKLGWIQFYENLMENFPPNIIVLELNRLLHSKKNSHSIEKKVLYLVRKKLNIFDNNIKLFSENLDAKGKF